MRRLADQPNMHTKLSALGTFIRRNDPDHIAQVIGETVEIFGPEHCLWGSNFPIEKLWTSYADLAAAYRQALASFPAATQRAALAETAIAVYRL